MKHYIIPVFIPHLGCKHQCIFCNQKKITGCQTPVTAAQVSALISERIKGINQERRIEVAFYGGSFTALDEHIQNALLAPASEALASGDIHAIRLSTRPDCITPNIINNLCAQGVSIVELGVQSMDDCVLNSAKRGHDSQDVINAVKLLKNSGIHYGIQLMPGLPGEDWLSLIKTVRQIINLRPEFVRIYPTVVIADTALAALYEQGEYRPLSLEQAIVRAAYMKLLFERQNIKVVRTGLQASAELDNKTNIIAGSYHPAFGELVDSFIFFLMVAGFIEQNRDLIKNGLIIHHHPQDCSKLRGQHNSNIKRLIHAYGIKAIVLCKDSSVKKEGLVFEHNGYNVLFSKDMIKCI